MKRLWKIVKLMGENLPLLLCFAAAFWAGYVVDDRQSMYFFILLAGFFMVLRELAEIRAQLKKLSEDDGGGRHSGGSSVYHGD